MEGPQALHGGNDRLLNGILRLGISEPAFDRRAVDEPPIRVKKDSPVLLVVPVFEPAQERPPGRKQVLDLVLVHFSSSNTPTAVHYIREEPVLSSNFNRYLSKQFSIAAAGMASAARQRGLGLAASAACSLGRSEERR